MQLLSLHSSFYHFTQTQALCCCIFCCSSINELEQVVAIVENATAAVAQLQRDAQASIKTFQEEISSLQGREELANAREEYNRALRVKQQVDDFVVTSTSDIAHMVQGIAELNRTVLPGLLQSVDGIAEFNRSVLPGLLQSVDGIAASLPNYALSSSLSNYALSSSLSKYAKGCSGVSNNVWQQHITGVITKEISTTSCKFTTTPKYFTALVGRTSHYVFVGVTSIYSASANSFRVYLRHTDGKLAYATPQYAKDRDWKIQWIGIP